MMFSKYWDIYTKIFYICYINYITAMYLCLAQSKQSLYKVLVINFDIIIESTQITKKKSLYYLSLCE
jgi:hypothetical protein